MKRIICPALIIAALFTAFTSYSQFHLGVKAGANLTKIDGKAFKDEFSFNYLVGAFAEAGLGNKFSIQPEVLYNQTSSTTTNNYEDLYQDIISSDQSKAKLGYLSIPVLLSYQLAGPLYIEAGPQFSILTSKDKDFFEESKGAFKNGDFSLVAGAQLKISKLRVSGRYVAGMQNIADAGNSDKWTNRAIQLALGLAIF